MSMFVVDVEAGGPCPGLYSMTELGAIRIDKELQTTFYATFRPISNRWQEEALKVTCTKYEDTILWPEPKQGMVAFSEWINRVNEGGGPIFLSDNPAFDWQFVNYYFHLFLGFNPFGFSARRIGDIYSGLMRDLRKGSEWKKRRVTKHTHNPVDDARGNAEAFLSIVKEFNL